MKTHAILPDSWRAAVADVAASRKARRLLDDRGGNAVAADGALRRHGVTLAEAVDAAFWRGGLPVGLEIVERTGAGAPLRFIVGGPGGVPEPPAAEAPSCGLRCAMSALHAAVADIQTSRIGKRTILSRREEP